MLCGSTVKVSDVPVDLFREPGSNGFKKKGTSAENEKFSAPRF
jgi:hypothetical protein